jgi:hypothetical protein
LHVCGPRPTKADLLVENVLNVTISVPFYYGAGMTAYPYDKHQQYFSINPDEDASLTNYFIFPDFDNFDPLCAIFVRKCVQPAAAGVQTIFVGLLPDTAVVGMDIVAITGYHKWWWKCKMNERQKVYVNTKFRIMMYARGDNRRYSASEHSFS